MGGANDGRPTLDEAGAVRIAREVWGIDGTAQALPGERDRNFRIVGRDSQGAAIDATLKVAPANEPRAALEFQDALLAHVAQDPRTASIAPRSVAAIDGRSLVEIKADDGRTHAARLVTWLAGRPMANVQPKSADLASDLGRRLGELGAALASFEHPGAAREDFEWDLARGLDVVRANADAIQDPARRRLLDGWLERLAARVESRLADLPRAVVHGDANDHNVLVRTDADGSQRVSGLIDFGDALETVRAADVAIAGAYVVMGKRAPLFALAALVRGYQEAHPLTEAEVELIGELAALRLSVSVALAARNARLHPDDAYLQVSAEPAWGALERLAEIEPARLAADLRRAAGFEPAPRIARALDWLRDHPSEIVPAVEAASGSLHVAPRIDLSIASPLLTDLGRDLTADEWGPRVEALWRAHPSERALGHHDEARPVYTSAGFAVPDDDRGEAHPTELGERRTVHLGVDVFGPAGTPIAAPVRGRVVSVALNDQPLDYGPTVIVRHEPANGVEFDALYGHLDPEVLERLEPGARLEAGALVGRFGAPEHNGGWSPHLHLQLFDPELEVTGNAPGVAAPRERDTWCALSPDPAPLLGLDSCAAPRRTTEERRGERGARLGPSLSLSYAAPLTIVRGRGRHLYDDEGRAYLDGVNNVCHVGHCHPHVVGAGAAQMAVLNTNTRYLHDHILRYSERLLAKLPPHLDTLFLVNSGSEANELALRMARAATGAEDLVVQEAGYHGNTRAAVEISHYKFAGKGGFPCPAHVHVSPLPDPDHGLHRGTDSGPRYVEEVEALLQTLAADGKRPAAMIAEALIGCGGQIVPPPGYLAGAFDAVRRAGGLAIADEVQVGFGRVGTHFWAFEADGATPDIVTMGKPIGNGHPLGAVATTRAVAGAFANGMEYFNTFGGNPVSCAIGEAVLDVIEDEGLVQNAHRVGESLLAALRDVGVRHPAVGAVRGRGLYVGVELSVPGDGPARHPAGALARYVTERLRQRGVLLSTDGPHANVLKIKPPIVFTSRDAELVARLVDETLAEDPARALAQS